MAQIHEMEPLERRDRVKITQQAGTERREEFTHDLAAERVQKLWQATNIIWLLTGAMEGLIGLRVLLKLVAANPNNLFASFIYNFTRLFVGAFLGLTVSPSAQGVVLEIPSLIAMLVYGLAAWFIVKLIWIVFEKPRARSVSIYERDQKASQAK